jgi:hypothetical protein
MKTNSKLLFIKGLKYAIDLVLILQFVAIIIGIITTIELTRKNPSDIVSNNKTTSATMSSPINNVMIAFSNPDLGNNIESIKKQFYISIFLIGLISIIALILITLQFKYIFKSFSQEDYFYPSNSIRIKKIAIIIFVWVIADCAIRYIPEIIIPPHVISSSIGLNSFSHGGSYGMFGFNLKMLIVSIIIYMLSIVFKYGNNLKEESSLTI